MFVYWRVWWVQIENTNGWTLHERSGNCGCPRWYPDSADATFGFFCGSRHFRESVHRILVAGQIKHRESRRLYSRCWTKLALQVLPGRNKTQYDHDPRSSVEPIGHWDWNNAKIGNAILVSGWAYPFEKYDLVSWDDEITNIWKNSKPPTRRCFWLSDCSCM